MSLQLSPDGRLWWDGARWLPVSEDGLWRWDGKTWLALNGTGSEVDLLICFDTTGSMSDKIASLVAQTATFVREATTRRFNLRWALIAFGDLRVPGDRIVKYPLRPKLASSLRPFEACPSFRAELTPAKHP